MHTFSSLYDVLSSKKDIVSMHHYCLLLYQTGLYLQVFLRIQFNYPGHKKTPSGII